jgi:hypothetical protein
MMMMMCDANGMAVVWQSSLTPTISPILLPSLSRSCSYFFPILIAVVSFVARWLTDATCSATVCRATSNLLSHLYLGVVAFLGFIAATKAKQIKDLFLRVQQAISVMTNDKAKRD